MNDNKFQMRCSDEFLDLLRQLAAADHRTESDYIRATIYRNAEASGITPYNSHILP